MTSDNILNIKPPMIKIRVNGPTKSKELKRTDLFNARNDQANHFKTRTTNKAFDWKESAFV